MTRQSLLSLFVPPKDHIGDFGLFCGFTADREVLERLKRNFSGDTSRIVLASFIHPTLNAVTDIPGLAWMWVDTRRSTGEAFLLHAKVALLGFRDQQNSCYTIRLVVSTGNWTNDPLSTSIDLFWYIDVKIGEGSPAAQDCADIRLAWTFFEWLRRKTTNLDLLELEYDGRRPDALLAKHIDSLRPTTAAPRFIHNIESPLVDQVVRKLTYRSPSRNCLILGSGFYGSAVKTEKVVPEIIRRRLQKDLAEDSELHLFLNPGSCQGIHMAAPELAPNWSFRRAQSPWGVHDSFKLHAKFIVLASRKGSRYAEGRMYLGSGNLTEKGFMKSAGPGNLEAGVVMNLPENLQWRRNGRCAIHHFLPVQFDECVSIHDFQPGEPFEEPPLCENPPPITYFIWEDGWLRAPDHSITPVVGPDGKRTLTPCDWPAPAPTFVESLPGGWRLPVMSDGALVVPKPTNLTVEDVLSQLETFPEPAEQDDETDTDFDGFDEDGDGHDAPSKNDGTMLRQYPIRRMMTLLVRLSEAQVRVDRLDWPRWCRELRQILSQLTTHEAEMIGFFREAGANPLPVLCEPRFIPKDVELQPLQEALVHVARQWKLHDKPSLWTER